MACFIFEIEVSATFSLKRPFKFGFQPMPINVRNSTDHISLKAYRTRWLKD